ncbi:MAG: glutamine synthetase III [Clostridia bacterium]|nr:glutamine synthetase III [Clostridia bacterium]NLV33274.1 glutamine synthetase type III [Clostridiaceae bacterium]HQM96151.1 glutamine synthetase III [Clostridia bacterium]HQO69058.1 glutamine synthetase III [Clostridia bacterium]
MEGILDIFASNVYNDKVMKDELPAYVYESLKKTIEQGGPLEDGIADTVASSMKDWAIRKGATHYTHWFQPMTGITAEKHDSFLMIRNNVPVMELRGKELIKGEPDASSFPSGGLRATFEARGYTTWDATSYAFIKDKTLCIPTAFCSYCGEPLDNKTPLLRSMDALNKQALRIVRLFGNTTASRVTPVAGCEQEYFLIDKKQYDKRKDLLICGRTLFGAKSPKGQELNDHYFGNIRERVQNFMRELDVELWKLGITAKTEHNEAAPAQHEIAPIYTTVNIAADHNQLIMEMLKKVAEHHGLACLLHEKPFENINGSGKHNNWSIATNEGDMLLKPGKNPSQNKRFLLILAAVLRAVDEYAGLLRQSIATAGNDHRLGSHEAPPGIISVYLGAELTEILEDMLNGRAAHDRTREKFHMSETLPVLFKDTCDRNRTSPFAFTGNKFEFRMPGSSCSVSDANTVINTIVADSFKYFADILEKADDFDTLVDELIKDTVIKHRRIIFNGNNYSNEWVEEAKKRGLPILNSTPEAVDCLIDKKNVQLFERFGIFSKTDLVSRHEIKLENYCKIISIESRTMIEIAKREILPAAMDYARNVYSTVLMKKDLGLDISSDKILASHISDNITNLSNCISKLENLTEKSNDAYDFKTKVVPAMKELRYFADTLECVVSKNYWPMPTYSDMLYSV